MPPTDEPGRRYRSPRHGEPDPRWGGPAAVAPVEDDDPYGDVTSERPVAGRHGVPDDEGLRPGDDRSGRSRHGGSDAFGAGDPYGGGDRYGSADRYGGDADPLGGPSSPGSWPAPPGRSGVEEPGPTPLSPTYGRQAPPPGGSSPYGQAPPSPPYGQQSPGPSPYGGPSSYGGPSYGGPSYGGPSYGGPSYGPSPYGQAPPSPPYGQAPPSPPYGQAPPPPGPSAPAGPSSYGQAPSSPPYGQSSAAGRPPVGPPSSGDTGRNGYGAPNAQAPNAQAPNGQNGQGAGGRAAPGPGGTAVQPPVDDRSGAPARAPESAAPLLAGGTPPPRKRDAEGSPSASDPEGDDDEAGTSVLGANPARHRRGGATAGPGRDEDAADTSGPGRRSRSRDRADDAAPGGKKKRKGSFWRELPLLIVVAIVLTFVIQTFIARIYVIPSASMEQTLHGCDGCANDRVAVDKVTYRFGDPSPGDVVVFKGPQAWLDNDEVGEEQPSSNALIRGFQDALSLVGLAAPNEKDFVKRVIATGGQTVACCDATNHVLVDGKPINEPYLYFQPGLGDKQATFDPVRVPDGQLWVMGDNRNNSADARFHGPVPVSDVIGKVRVVVLPISRWRSVPAIDPQTTTAALGGTAPLGTGTAGAAAGALLAVPVVGVGRRLRRASGLDTSTAAPPHPDLTESDLTEPGPADAGEGSRAAETDRE